MTTPSRGPRRRPSKPKKAENLLARDRMADRASRIDGPHENSVVNAAVAASLLKFRHQVQSLIDTALINMVQYNKSTVAVTGVRPNGQHVGIILSLGESQVRDMLSATGHKDPNE